MAALCPGEQHALLLRKTDNHTFLCRASGAGLFTTLGEESRVKYLEGPLPQLPSTKADVEAVLFPGRPDIQLPVTPVYYHTMKRRCPLTAAQQLKQADVSSLVVRITSLLDHRWRGGYSGMHTSVHVHKFIEEAFESLEEYSSHKATCDIMLASTEHRRAARSKTARERLRPDTVVALNKCTLLLGGDRFCVLGDAIKDLKRKRRSLEPAHYGEVRFLLAYAAGGKEFQWLWMPAAGKEVSSLCFLCCTVLFASKLDISHAPHKAVGNQGFQ